MFLPVDKMLNGAAGFCNAKTVQFFAIIICIGQFTTGKLIQKGGGTIQEGLRGKNEKTIVLQPDFCFRDNLQT